MKEWFPGIFIPLTSIISSIASANGGVQSAEPELAAMFWGGARIGPDEPILDLGRAWWRKQGRISMRLWISCWMFLASILDTARHPVLDAVPHPILDT